MQMEIIVRLITIFGNFFHISDTIKRVDKRYEEAYLLGSMESGVDLVKI